MTNAPDHPSKHAVDGNLLALAFGLGWAASDEAHFPSLPLALARVVGVPAARMAIVRGDGTTLMVHTFPSVEERGDDQAQQVYEVEESLGTEYTLRLSVESAEKLTPAQSDLFHKALRLIHAAFDCILLQQRDRDALGEPFARLSDREWQICLALERPDGEKQIAGLLACSRHTVHSYIKSLYRKLQVQRRLQLLDQLKRAREQLRRQTLENFDGPAERPD